MLLQTRIWVTSNSIRLLPYPKTSLSSRSRTPTQSLNQRLILSSGMKSKTRLARADRLMSSRRLTRSSWSMWLSRYSKRNKWTCSPLTQQILSTTSWTHWATTTSWKANATSRIASTSLSSTSCYLQIWSHCSKRCKHLWLRIILKPSFIKCSSQSSIAIQETLSIVMSNLKTTLFKLCTIVSLSNCQILALPANIILKSHQLKGAGPFILLLLRFC